MRWLREPLLHFLLIGAGLFLLFGQVGDAEVDRPDRIVVTGDDIDRIATLWARRWQRPPTPDELDGLIEAHIREEVLYREARALGLERDDTIVRRRMAQKMEFLFQDLAEPGEPTEEALTAFLRENVERFQEPARLSFVHVYLSVDRRGAAAADDSRELLAELRSQQGDADPVEAGDTFMFGNRFDEQSEREVSRLFGKAFSDALAAVPLNEWQGPIESAYGLHLVYVRDRVMPLPPTLPEVRDRVRAELVSVRQREANEAVFRQLRERYEVVVERPDAGRLGERSASAP